MFLKQNKPFQILYNNAFGFLYLAVIIFYFLSFA